MLKEKLGTGKLRFTDAERRRSAIRTGTLERKLPAQFCTGVFHDDDQIELIEGEPIQMALIGGPPMQLAKLVTRTPCGKLQMMA